MTVEVVVPGPSLVVEVPVPETPAAVEVQVPGIVGPTGPAGPAGPTGPPGPTGGGTAARSFTSPATTWVFDHGLGFIPAVMLYDPSGRQIGGQVTLNTATTTTVDFAIPVTGSMSLS